MQNMIKRAYRRLMAAYHPAKKPSNIDEATASVQYLNHICELLTEDVPNNF